MATEHFPPYEEGKLYNADDHVYLERLCTCGAILRVRGRVSDVMSFLANWKAGHSGSGHSPTDKVTAAKARSDAHEAAFRVGQEKGDIPADQEFEPIDWDKKNFGVTNDEVYA